MSEEVRRIARRARRLGYKSVTLGQWTNADWDAFRQLIDAPDVPDIMLADAVDTLQDWEQQGARNVDTSAEGG